MLKVTKQTLRIEEAHIAPDSNLVGQNLVEADIGRKTGTMILAIRSADGSQRFNPPPKEVILKENDILIAIGTPEQVENLRNLK
jgi:K+/H+ antiporter YhaU regulatory subunit KhtT